MTPGEAVALVSGVFAPCGGAIAWVWTTLSARIAVLEERWQDCEQRWAREVRRGAAMAAMPIDPFTPPASLPAPDWDEPTGVRDQRALLEAEGFRAGLAETLRTYVEERTPPRIPPRRKT